jgi:hypothetical protein
MNRLLAFRASEPERLRTVLARHAGVLPGAAPSDKTPVPGQEAPPRREGSLHWGVAFYLGGEPLVQRFTDEAARGAAAPSEIRTDHLLAQCSPVVADAAARAGQPAAQRPASLAQPHAIAPPVRYRRFLFAAQGDLSLLGKEREARRAALLPALASNLRGDGDEELLFHGLLQRMHEADPSYLDDPELPFTVAVAALGQTLALAGAGPQHAALSNGQWLAVARRGAAPLWYRAVSGLSKEGPESAGAPSGDGDDGFRAVVAFADLDAPAGGSGLTEVPDGHALVIGPDMALQIVPLLP